MNEFGRNWGSAIAQSFEAREVIVFQFLELSQHINHRRHQYRMGDTFALDGLTEGLRTKLRNRGLTGAESWRCEHEGKVRNVKYRRRVKIHSTFSVTHPIINVGHICENICVCQRHALRQTSGAARIDQSES